MSKIDATISQMSDILKNSPTNIHARVSRGCLYATQNRWAEALVDLNQAIAKEPGSKNTLLAYLKRGQYYFNTGVFDRAHADINIAKQLADSSDNVSQKTRADIDLLSGEIYKKRTMTLPLRSMSSGGVGRSAGEEKAYHEMNDRLEQHREDQLVAAMSLQSKFKGNIQEFLEHCFSDIKIAEHDYAKRFLRVKGMMAEGKNFHAVIAEMDDIIAINQKDICRVNPDLFFVRAMAYYQVKRITDAITDIEKAMRMAPDFAIYRGVHSLLLAILVEDSATHEEMELIGPKTTPM